MVEGFSSTPMVSGKKMRQLVDSSPDAFLRAALELLLTAKDSPGSQYLLTLLCKYDRSIDVLSDPYRFTLPEAVSLTRKLFRADPVLDLRMVRRLVDAQEQQAESPLERSSEPSAAVRLLEIIAAVSDGGRVLPLMNQLLSNPNLHIRSKAALLVGRSNKNSQWVQQRMADRDPRVRGNAVESLWNVKHPSAAEVFWGALADPDNRVVGNALYGLYLMGEVSSIPLIIDLLTHPAEAFRKTGIWVMGQTGDPRFQKFLLRLLQDSESKHWSTLLRALSRLKQQKDRLAGAGSLCLRAGAVERDGRPWMRVSLTVSRIAGNGLPSGPVTGLRTMQFALWQSGSLVTDYKLDEYCCTENLHVAFAVPRLSEANDAFQESLDQAFARALKHKRPSDRWMIAKYRSDDSEASQSQPASALAPEDRYLSDVAAIAEAVSDPGLSSTIAPTFGSVIRSLLQPGSARGRRHVVVIPNPRMPAELALRASTGKFSFDTVPAGEVVEGLEHLVRSFIHRYELRFRPPVTLQQEDAGDFKIEVHCEQGIGCAGLSVADDKDVAVLDDVLLTLEA